jgi:hypothetical protein
VTEVVLESGRSRVFASAADWPGWCRSGRDENAAMAALAAAASRVAARAGLAFPARAAEDFTVAERVTGDATTDFGAPSVVSGHDRAPLAAAAASRRANLLAAAWAEFGDVAAGAPAVLRKGPRGGGRDRDQIVAHVLETEAMTARKLGLRAGVPADLNQATALRAAITGILRQPSDGAPVAPRGWPARYACARLAWHALDHAWEIQDKS